MFQINSSKKIFDLYRKTNFRVSDQMGHWEMCSGNLYIYLITNFLDYIFYVRNRICTCHILWIILIESLSNQNTRNYYIHLGQHNLQSCQNQKNSGRFLKIKFWSKLSGTLHNSPSNNKRMSVHMNHSENDRLKCPCIRLFGLT